jgi:putative DNA primase/helicase
MTVRPIAAGTTSAIESMNPRFKSLDERADRELARLERAKKYAPPLPKISPDDGIELIDAASLKPEPIRWLWPGWLARGKLHVLAGAPGTGKTTIATHLAACVSAGLALPSGWRSERGNVLIWSGEDDPADTLVPRLIAASADLTRIKFVGDVRTNGRCSPFDPARDVPLLAVAAASLGDVALLIVDPLVSAVSGDSHKNAEVRRGLAPLVEFAAKRDAALLGITHYSKGTQGREPLERVSGSLAFGALARVVFGTVKQETEGEEAPRKMMLARAKSNIGPDGGGFTYAFEQIELLAHNGLAASRIVWGAAVEGSARELLAESETGDGDSEARVACTWLRDLLAAAPMPVKDVRKQGDDSGFAWRTLQRVMRAAGVESKRAGFGMPATWALVTRATVAPVTPTKWLGANGEVLARLDDAESIDL